MANIKISQLTAATSASGTQEFEVNDSGTSKKVTGSQIKTYVKDGLVVSDITDLTATASELNILDGVTATTAELNILDGVTTSTAELNFVDGVTSAIQPQLDAKAATSAGVPRGAVAHFAMNTAPTGWLKANGAAVSRTTYATLFAAIGTTFGVGDGSTTFNLPDLRGEFMRGWDDSRGVDSARAFGSSQSHQMESHNHVDGFPRSSGSYSNSLYGTISGATYSVSSNFGSVNPTRFANTSSAGGTSNSSENRPRNIALLACIKY